MRGIYTPVTDIRRKVFTEVARMAYEVNELSDYEKLMRELPFKIIPGEEKSLRSSIFLERAIISERVRLAMGMSLRPLDESVPASEGLEHSVIADKYYEPPLIIHQVCLQRLPGEGHQGHGHVPGLPGAPLPGGLPEARHQLPQRQEPH